MKAPKQHYQAKIVEFRLLWLSVEQVVGNAYMPLFAQAQNIQEFIADIDSQSNPIRKVIEDSYNQSQCNSLNSPTDPFIILDILGETLFQQKQQDHVDVAIIDQIERIGLHICKKFISEHQTHDDSLSVLNNTKKFNTKQDKTLLPKSPVISLCKVRKSKS